jgi:hypothetical protein
MAGRTPLWYNYLGAADSFAGLKAVWKVKAQMLQTRGNKQLILGLCFAGLLFLLVFQLPAWADSPERTSVNVLVKDTVTDQPIINARLTLRFREPGGKARLKRSKTLSFSAKTNVQGRYKFTNIPKGTIHLIVTAERHQSFGQDFELEQDNQLIEVKLKKPQPLL